MKTRTPTRSTAPLTAPEAGLSVRVGICSAPPSAHVESSQTAELRRLSRWNLGEVGSLFAVTATAATGHSPEQPCTTESASDELFYPRSPCAFRCRRQPQHRTPVRPASEPESPGEGRYRSPAELKKLPLEALVDVEITSASRRPEDNSLAAGFSRHFTKPVDWQELKTEIQRIAFKDN